MGDFRPMIAPSGAHVQGFMRGAQPQSAAGHSLNRIRLSLLFLADIASNHLRPV
jgi:hypothetical protein